MKSGVLFLLNVLKSLFVFKSMTLELASVVVMEAR